MRAGKSHVNCRRRIILVNENYSYNYKSQKNEPIKIEFNETHPFTNCSLVIFLFTLMPSVSKTPVANFFGSKSPVCAFLPTIVN